MVVGIGVDVGFAVAVGSGVVPGKQSNGDCPNSSSVGTSGQLSGSV